MDDVKNPFTGRWVTVYRVDLYEWYQCVYSQRDISKTKARG